MNKELLLAALVFINCNSSLQAQLISTVAGNGNIGSTGNNGPATAASLNGPFNVAVDDKGNVFIADRFNNMVRKVDTFGAITTIAGNGTAGYSGGGIAATSALLNAPTGVAVDKRGNVYIADHANHCVRKVSASGIITTIAGNAVAGYSGDKGPAAAALLNGPRGVTIDRNGNVYIADAGNHRVRKITPDGLITTVAGNGDAGFSGDGYSATAASLHGPYSVSTDYLDNIYIADVDNQRIRRVDRNGIISTVAGNGDGGYNGDHRTATSASLFEPIGVATDRLGNIYIADGWNNRIRYVDMHTGIISTVAGNGNAGYNGDGLQATDAQLNAPYGVAVDNGENVFIADYSNNRIRKVSPPLPSSTAFDMVAFPNPSPGTFAIKVSSGRNDLVTIVITDVTGRKLHESSIKSNTVADFSPALASGMYYIRANSANSRAYARLIILH